MLTLLNLGKLETHVYAQRDAYEMLRKKADRILQRRLRQHAPLGRKKR